MTHQFEKDRLERSLTGFLSDLERLLSRHQAEINPLTDGGIQIVLGTTRAWISVEIPDDTLDSDTVITAQNEELWVDGPVKR